MTMDSINEILDAIIRGSLLGFLAGFWLMGLAAIWKWFLGVAKRFLHWLFPKAKWFQPKEQTPKGNQNQGGSTPRCCCPFCKGMRL